MTPIVVCADDYGLAPGVCDGIEALIAQGRLSATSCMTGCPSWTERAAGLRALVADHPADIGLHLTLTDQAPLAGNALAGDALGGAGGALPPIGRLIALAHARRLPAAALASEIRAQLDAFEDAYGAPPDFVDGHQHCHQLPQVRDALLAELSRRGLAGRAYVRSCREPLGALLSRRIAVPKAVIVGAIGGRFPALAERAGFASNDSFRGIYDFTDRVPYRALFRSFLRGPGRRVLIHCHPGRVDAVLQAADPLTAPRDWELAYLGSAACADDLAEAGVRVARFRAV